MIQKPPPHKYHLDADIVKEALRWVHENKGLTVGKDKYSSPRISSEISDCSMPLTFDQYNYCSLGCQYCVVGGTFISAPGKRKAIEKLEVGDEIYSYNLKTSQIEIDIVSSLMQRTVDETISIELENGKSLTVTANHPVYVNGKGWIDAGDLTEGDDLLYVANAGAKFKMTESNPMKRPEVKKKQSKAMKKAFASGSLENLRGKLRASGIKNLQAYNKSEECRKKVSERMRQANPMKTPDIRKKVSKNAKQRFATGKQTPYWKGKEKPDAAQRMSGSGNPMKDPTKRKETLRKIVASWRRKGCVSEGEKRIHKALKSIEANFIFQGIFEGPKRDYVADFFLPDQKLCIEYDGHSKHYSKDGIEFDKKRDAFMLRTYGIQTVRIHRDQAFIPDEKLRALLQKEAGL